MPYAVSRLTWDVYMHAAEDANDAEVLEAFLNAQESEGWQLVAVVPHHPSWDTEGVSQGHRDVKLIFHR